MAREDILRSWNDTPTRAAVAGFVAHVTEEGSPGYVPPPERVATFDNDGTLWCEKPIPIQLDFILRHFAAAAGEDPALRDRQPWKAAYSKDFGWLNNAMVKHYGGDDADLKVLIAGLLTTFGGMSVEGYEQATLEFIGSAQHPTLGRLYAGCAFQPMIELLRYLEANGFTTFIASGGDRDFMRPVAVPIYAIPPDRVIGSSFGLSYQEDDNGGGSVIYKTSLDVFDDGPEKPVRIWSRIGRRRLVAGGNSNGDIPMLQFTGGAGRPALRMLVRHDDEAREFSYTAGAEDALARAADQGWIVVSIKDDWSTVFAAPPAVFATT